jgi:ABC-type multidrug transport system fused ATPase/permease subunit
VKQALSELTPRPTTLVIARRYSMVKNADHVVVLAQGESVQQGTPEELVPAGGWFATLAMQSTRDVA